MNTVTKTLLESHWNEKYEVYELKQFKDDRGMVCETFRLDDDLLKDAKMCYISETEPFVMRGPHEHAGQTDFFVSWKTRMVYQMYNKETDEMKFFVTEPDKMYLVKVAPPIIHSYRNISLETSKTLNYPTSLFMGEDKKEEIDEIRHEPIVEDNDIIVLFGATGRLGSALTDKLYSNMKYHKYDLVPLYDKLHNKEDVTKLFIKLQEFKGKNVTFINCSGVTNVQDSGEENILYWTNTYLPSEFAKKCSNNGWKFIQFSTDYVFQEAEKFGVSLSPYTNSKKLMEKEIESIGEELENCSIIRVANLFSTKEQDLHNLIYKMWLKVRANQTISIDERINIYPTDVEVLSNYLVENFIFNMSRHKGIKYYNMASEGVPLKTFLSDFFNYSNIEIKNSLLNNWTSVYNKNIINVGDSKESIINIINNLKEK